MKNEYLVKFDSEDYLKGDSLKAEEHGNITIRGNIITFSHLEFDEEIKININYLVLCKGKSFDNDWKINTFIDENQGTPISISYEKIDIEFSGCVFNKNVNLYPDENTNITFDGCEFNGHFKVENKYSSENQKIKIKNILIQYSIFKKDFTVYKAEIKSIEIKNVDFESLSEFNEVILQEKFDLKEITYKGFALFDKCIFNTKAEFEYIIFEKSTSFKGTTFNYGLNLDFTSGEKEINFFGIKGLNSDKSKANTSQETYRIIKYNFEKIGNKIEANKYHALELDQKRRELENNDFSKDYWVFKFHYIFSRHSTDWWLALGYIFAVGILTVFCIHFNIAKDLFFHPDNFKIEYISKIFNEFFKYIYIGSIDEKLKSYPFVFFFNKLFLGYLYYQFLTAIRKDTRK